MKAKELENLTIEELKQKLFGLKKELFSLRESLYTTKLEKPHKIKLARKDIARVITVLKERERQDDKKYKKIA